MAVALAAEPLDRDALALVEDLLGELRWCSGSPDFNEGGQARLGWLRGPVPVMVRADEWLRLARLTRGAPEPSGAGGTSRTGREGVPPKGYSGELARQTGFDSPTASPDNASLNALAEPVQRDRASRDELASTMDSLAQYLRGKQRVQWAEDAEAAARALREPSEPSDEDVARHLEMPPLPFSKNYSDVEVVRAVRAATVRAKEEG
jgi:hypothetical protein